MSGFVDEAQLNVKGGDGGAGCVSFRREGPEAFGGPNGGDGGKGGDVWLVADRNVASLVAFRDHPHRKAGSGTHGKGKDMHGRTGEDCLIYVPEGTVIKDLYTDEALADLVHHGDRWLAADGGRGGRGNAKFLTNARRAPVFAEQGEVGAERWMKLEIKLMADVALVGFPNAGKSTFISRISAAKPKIADYPFTTLEPHLGVVREDGMAEFVVADIPGLIEGASEGRGLGHQFLRHIERARVLCILIDLAPTEAMTPAEQEEVLLRELGAYDASLLARPRLVVGAKADVTFDRDDVELMRMIAEDEAPRGDDDVAPIGTEWWSGLRMSSATGEGLRQVVGGLAQLVEEARNAEPERDGFIVFRPEPEGIWIERLDEHEFRVRGRAAERVVMLNDVSTNEALGYIDARMKRLGVHRALVRAGCREGDVVWIGAFSFEYEPEI